MKLCIYFSLHIFMHLCHCFSDLCVYKFKTNHDEHLSSKTHNLHALYFCLLTPLLPLP